MITLAERAPNRRVNEERKLRQQAIKMKVAAPGIVQAFDAKEQNRYRTAGHPGKACA